MVDEDEPFATGPCAGMFGCFGIELYPDETVTGILAGRIAPPRASNGPAVSRMQSKKDATSPPFTKSSRNCIFCKIDYQITRQIKANFIAT
jgi:hypothetical protein